MGKSEKKMKSDRINLLRKQYDAFLEEDKKRRERNEYILGKLDKMRMSTALVLRNRLSQLVIDPRSNPCDRYTYEDNKPSAPIQSLVPVKSYTSCRLDDEDMLKEISKKYILIPKLSPAFATEDLHRQDNQTISDTGDWKSKYDILTKLKQDKKESDIGKNFDNPLKSEPLDCSDIPVRDSNKTTESTVASKVQFLDDLINVAQPIDVGKPKLFAQEEVNWTSNRNEDNLDLTAVDAIDNKIHMCNVDVTAFPSQQENTAPFVDEYQAEAIDTDNVIYANVSKNNSDDVHLEEDCNNEPQYAYVAQPETYVDKELSGNPNKINNYENNETASEYAQNENFTEHLHNPTEEYQLNHEMVGSSATLLAAANDDQIPTIKAQEIQEYTEQSQSVDVINSEDLMPDQGVALVDGENINPPGYEEHVAVDEQIYDPNTQHPTGDQSALEINNTVDESQISEFDKENKEMFYSEEQNVAYEQYNTQEEYAPNTEQANPAAPAGAYDENGQFVYYEGDTQDPVYPVEYAENEATMQPYDQTYEQQYGDGMYGDQQYQQETYDQQQYQQQGVEQPHLYENIEQYREQPNENVEDVQQQLDQEQGYTEQVVESEQEAPQVTTPDNAKPEDTDPKPVDAAQTG